MKLIKFLTVGALVAASASSYAQDINIYLTGSTAFRSATNQAIGDLLGATGQVGYSGSSLQGASQVVATGTLTVSGVSHTVAIYTNWSGSEAGYQAVASTTPTSLAFINASAISGMTVGSTTSLSSPATFTADANANMADNAQTESTQHGAGFTTLKQNRVGIVPFVWVKGTSNSAAVQTGLNSLTNMTIQQAQLVLTNLGTPLSVWTGNNGDFNTTIYPTGRDTLSGTRLNMLLEANLASKNAVNATIYQYGLNVSGGQIVDFGSTANGGAPTDEAPLANSDGYSSGGTLISGLSSPVSTSIPAGKVAFVAYAGTSDASGLPGVTFNKTTDGTFSYSGANTSPILSYNGVPYSYANLANGTYTYWGYEYLCYNLGTLPSLSQTFLTANLLPRIQADCQATGAGMPLNSAWASRLGAGQLVTPGSL